MRVIFGMSSSFIILAMILFCGRLRSLSVITIVFPLGIWDSNFFIRVSFGSVGFSMFITLYCGVFWFFILFSSGS